MENREATLATVMERIAVMTANPVEPNPGDEWPTLTAEQVSDFRELVHDLANLCFEPDYKERSVLDIVISDKKRFDLQVFFQERDIDLYDTNLSEREFMQGFGRAVRQATSMVGQGQEMLRRYAEIAQHRASTRAETDERENDLAGARKLLDEGRLDEFRAEADRLMDKFDPRDEGHDGSYRRVPEELQEMIDEYGLAIKGTKKGGAQVEGAINEINEYLDKAEALVEVYHRDVPRGQPNFDEAIGEARGVLNRYRYRVGMRALQSVVVRFNRLSNEHRAIKTLRERGVKVTLETAAA